MRREQHIPKAGKEQLHIPEMPRRDGADFPDSFPACFSSSSSRNHKFPPGTAQELHPWGAIPGRNKLEAKEPLGRAGWAQIHLSRAGLDAHPWMSLCFGITGPSQKFLLLHPWISAYSFPKFIWINPPRLHMDKPTISSFSSLKFSLFFPIFPFPFLQKYVFPLPFIYIFLFPPFFPFPSFPSFFLSLLATNHSSRKQQPPNFSWKSLIPGAGNCQNYRGITELMESHYPRRFPSQWDPSQTSARSLESLELPPGESLEFFGAIPREMSSEKKSLGDFASFIPKNPTLDGFSPCFIFIPLLSLFSSSSSSTEFQF